MSWGATRIFIRRARARGSVRAVAGQSLLDLVIGYLCLIALAALLANVAALYDRVVPAEMRLGWVAMAEMAMLWPFGAGFMVTGMLLTTLVPTMLHLTAGLGGATLWPAHGNAGLATELAQVPDEQGFVPHGLEERVVRALQRQRTRARWLIVPAAMAALLLTLALFFVPHLGELLFETALCSTGWTVEGDQCGPLLRRLRF